MKKYLKAPVAVILSALIGCQVCAYGFAAEKIAAEDTYDFSELNMLTNCTSNDPYGFDSEVPDGGNCFYSTAYLARWDGAVSESDDAYPSSGMVKDVVYSEKDASCHVQDVIWLPVRETVYDNGTIKSAIMKYGAVYTDFNCLDEYFNDDMTSYCISPDYEDIAGHAVAIVGWDDNYSKSNFVYEPKDNGAFICKNSWGKDVGENGYFYLSYFDECLGWNGSAVFCGTEKSTNYNKIYQYDMLGATSELVFGNDSTFANVFPQDGSTLTADEDVCAASFYTSNADVKYEVYVLTDYKDIGTLYNTYPYNMVSSGTVAYAGYHTVEFLPVTVKSGTRFAIVVKLFGSDDEKAGIFLEMPIRKYSSKARANVNESFAVVDNKWHDMTNIVKNSNVCIKAFTDTHESSLSLLQGIDNENRKYTDSRVYMVNEVSEYVSNDFVSYINSGRTDGTVPVPVKVGGLAPETAAEELPSKFDLRDVNGKCFVTSIKHQGNIGSCWTFATCASLESCTMREDMTLSHDSVVLTPGESLKLSSYANRYENTLYAVTWTSSDNAVASVAADGTVSAISQGTANITALSEDGQSELCAVTVRAPFVKATDFKLTEHEITIRYRSTKFINKEMSPDNVSMPYMNWTSDNNSVVIAYANGEIEATGRGTATITATTADGSQITDTCKVTVKYAWWQWLIEILLFGWIWY